MAETEEQVRTANRIHSAVAVMSGKGGVGKSSLAALLAVALSRSGQRVGLLDADITGPSIPRMFGLSERLRFSPFGIIPSTSANGIKVMSMNLLLDREDDAVIWRGPLISSAIKQFWSEVYWGELDTLVVDLPPGTSDASLTVMQSLPLNGVVLVTSPQDLAGMVVRKAASMAAQLGVPLTGLIENMSYLVCPHCQERVEVFGPSHAAETSERLGVPLLGRLPLDPELARLADSGAIEEYENSAISEISEQVSARLQTEPSKPAFADSKGGVVSCSQVNGGAK